MAIEDDKTYGLTGKQLTELADKVKNAGGGGGSDASVISWVPTGRYISFGEFKALARSMVTDDWGLLDSYQELIDGSYDLSNFTSSTPAVAYRGTKGSYKIEDPTDDELDAMVAAVAELEDKNDVYYPFGWGFTTHTQGTIHVGSNGTVEITIDQEWGMGDFKGYRVTFTRSSGSWTKTVAWGTNEWDIDDLQKSESMAQSGVPLTDSTLDKILVAVDFRCLFGKYPSAFAPGWYSLVDYTDAEKLPAILAYLNRGVLCKFTPLTKDDYSDCVSATISRVGRLSTRVDGKVDFGSFGNTTMTIPITDWGWVPAQPDGSWVGIKPVPAEGEEMALQTSANGWSFRAAIGWIAVALESTIPADFTGYYANQYQFSSLSGPSLFLVVQHEKHTLTTISLTNWTVRGGGMVGATKEWTGDHVYDLLLEFEDHINGIRHKIRLDPNFYENAKTFGIKTLGGRTENSIIDDSTPEAFLCSQLLYSWETIKKGGE